MPQLVGPGPGDHGRLGPEGVPSALLGEPITATKAIPFGLGHGRVASHPRHAVLFPNRGALGVAHGSALPGFSKAGLFTLPGLGGVHVDRRGGGGGGGGRGVAFMGHGRVQ